MITKRHLVKAQKFLLKICKQSISAIKKQIIWLLRTLFQTRKRRGSVNAGFVLPTVAMVALVVVLLTTAILFRSFERSKNASNVRVNEAVLNAAAPAIDRAKSKLNKLLSDATLPRATPTDTALESIFNDTTKRNEYTLGDETQVKLTSGTDNLRSAWMYPVDTDNNGLFDSYTLYGIYFKNPPVSGGVYTRARNPIEARTPPMVNGGAGDACKDTNGTSATLVGNSGWFKVGSKLKKAFFVYTANVPVTKTGTLPAGYERYKGNKGFSAIEYQQERVQLPLVNNAVVYEDDLEMTPGPKLNLNGRIVTNSNLLTGSGFQQVTLYQVSSPYSCFYEADNAKVIVAGNVGAGTFTSDGGDLTNGTLVHLFQGKGTSPNTATGNNLKDNKSVKDNSTTWSAQIAYNSLAYVKRINRLVDVQIANAASTDPQEVQNGPATKTRRELLELYFKKRTRRVPYAEVAFDSANPLKVGSGTDYATNSPLQGSGDSLRPVDSWVFPFDPSDGTTKTGYANLDLNKASGVTNRILPPATEPTKLEKVKQGNETFVGDRVAVGNNLPELWWDSTKSKFVGPNTDDTQQITTNYWDNPDNANTTDTSANNVRTRRSRIQQLADLGDIGRDGEWELAAAKIPATAQDPVGGLRVVTGAGIYLPAAATAATTTFTSYSTQIWPDLMPAKYGTVPTAIKPFEFYGLNIQYEVPQPAANTPYLQMRATAVYHYKGTSYNETSPTPIACVSSYYDPTNSTTAKNKSTLPWNNVTGGNSNNGIVYGPPTSTVSTYQNLLNYQAQLTYPNGRLVNEPLKKALDKLTASVSLTLSDKSAIDSALCALEIMDTATVKTPSDSAIPHGAIRETTFLDPRQIQAIDATTGSKNYDLNKKDRQPLEIRATALDVDALRKKTIGSGTPQEYLLPNSGIIYATRDDALPDQSAGTSAAAKLENPVDFKLDPTRRPNGIMLVNGSKLFRGTTNTYRDVEKGLILASNLPVYIKGDFNLHTQQEFGTASDTTGNLADDWSNFYTRTAAQRNPDFACRPNDPRLPNCTTGDEWRAAAVLADAVSLLSKNFREGFRNEGDYDWKPVASSIPADVSGYFSAINSYVPKFQWYDSTGVPKDLVTDVAGDATTTGFQGSSYLHNFVTPVMKWIPVPELSVEVCVPDPDLPAGSPCVWTLTTSNSGKPVGNQYPEGQPGNSIKTGTLANPTFLDPSNRFYGQPYRIAFVRDSNGNLVTPLKVHGIEDVSSPPSGRTKQFTVTNGFTFGAVGNVKVSSTNFMPWLEPIVSGNNITFKPILQIDNPFITPTNLSPSPSKIDVGVHGNWLQIAKETTFNLIIAAGDTPARSKEDNGGLHNFPRFVENWNPTGTVSDAIKARITGSFIQIKRSEYATAPYMVYLSDSSNGYAMTANLAGKIPYYLAPTRQWGYDVALLSQAPDRFAQKLVRIPDDLPDEYFREVGRDDNWVKTLLCAKKADDSYAIDADQRPACS
ncbi:MAG: hormogonium polysaccharide biosynthesis protein HpsA [Aulosira sp. ZfuVER01]|nr:hormogonium polysaccharide biosynthesis protein HpsA [Aulosira sp. ZfuVER01]MDZ7999226.1 hormogonium polysaccharide biosynthesis protein HpsA [Aulosira sp. DedVER01a]MDZ8051993.1 hormogonium polysaccharide biosynthesis protein HpsA [Aulosira sp. ZfuCHP01]